MSGKSSLEVKRGVDGIEVCQTWIWTFDGNCNGVSTGSGISKVAEVGIQLYFSGDFYPAGPFKGNGLVGFSDTNSDAILRICGRASGGFIKIQKHRNIVRHAKRT